MGSVGGGTGGGVAHFSNDGVKGVRVISCAHNVLGDDVKIVRERLQEAADVIKFGCVSMKAFELIAKEVDFGNAVVQGELLGEGDEMNEKFPYAADGDGVEIVTKVAIECVGVLV
ncbi:hypothetical protein SARC_00972 [Sphaeroforma arctica JP610]|uniref:Uncharacterized protein n=1 Tax=Sphaeroforma arctica JP610 TaxID=667725 RepID=A0A0L0GCY1_9EUKA|nr:hypothetical protein SARC_00972 [Sphaeroforma arctica JP610]KNC86877.1 hypothetical protein SARC_00972 [Sphaeroforma arctica JP610]|eukprot:XP_014160779.1 hypothetical protein SARC_00972 [Sphaeroforma arctica JP610]